jgi:single-strand DNA-binding protein
MSGSINKAILLGSLGADPEIRRTQDGRQIVNLRLATSETWKDKTTGERKERTSWHSVVIFSEPLAKVAEQYLRKGSKVYVEGQLQTRKWTDKTGAERYSTEVVLQGFSAQLVLLDRANNGAGEQHQASQPQQARQPHQAHQAQPATARQPIQQPQPARQASGDPLGNWSAQDWDNCTIE